MFWSGFGRFTEAPAQKRSKSMNIYTYMLWGPEIPQRGPQRKSLKPRNRGSARNPANVRQPRAPRHIYIYICFGAALVVLPRRQRRNRPRAYIYICFGSSGTYSGTCLRFVAVILRGKPLHGGSRLIIFKNRVMCHSLGKKEYLKIHKKNIPLQLVFA